MPKLHSEIKGRGRGLRLKQNIKRPLNQHYSSCSDDDEIVCDKSMTYPMFSNKKQKSKLNLYEK